ncbi:MAG TPA: HNH endonuclease [Bdellovibrionota bacterium]|jgi:5-methylcytosine-specific restriction endonuclease McrA
MQIQNLPLTVSESSLHERALAAASRFRSVQAELLGIIMEIDRCRLFEKLGHSSSFDYCVKRLGLSEDMACSFLSVARKSREVPQLRIAVEEGLPISKAKKIVTILTRSNGAEWIAKARENSYQKLEREIVKVLPQAKVSEKVKPISESRSKVELSLKEEDIAVLRRAQDLLSSKKGGAASLEEVLAAALREFVGRHDPVQKAARSRKNLTKHEVHKRDGGSCQARDGEGRICEQRRWLQLHHIKPRSEGGGDKPENLITLCAFHHRLFHKTTYPSYDG